MENKRVFAISYWAATTWFTIGYCEGWVRRGRRAVLDRPFVRAALFVHGGEIFFRGAWLRGASVKISDHDFSQVRWEPWMVLEHADLVAAADALKHCTRALDPKGFSRL